jgi:hypothetical protein
METFKSFGVRKKSASSTLELLVCIDDSLLARKGYCRITYTTQFVEVARELPSNRMMSLIVGLTTHSYPSSLEVVWLDTF